MVFTIFAENSTVLVDFVKIFSGLGFTTILLAVLKIYFQRYCWRKFKKQVNDWTDRLQESQDSHGRRPSEFKHDEWKVECERMLSDAMFSPSEISQVLETSVIVAKGIVAEKIFYIMD